MHAKLNDWQNGWMSVELGVHPSEIDQLIESLMMIRDDPDQHFHLSSDYKADGGLGDIEICALPDNAAHNMTIGGRALGPGDVV